MKCNIYCNCDIYIIYCKHIISYNIYNIRIAYIMIGLQHNNIEKKSILRSYLQLNLKVDNSLFINFSSFSQHIRFYSVETVI